MIELELGPIEGIDRSKVLVVGAVQLLQGGNSLLRPANEYLRIAHGFVLG